VHQHHSISPNSSIREHVNLFGKTCSLRLDYCNSVLYGAPVSSIQVLQRVQNSAARIVLQAAGRCHAQRLLRELHWLPIQHRIEYEVAVLTFKSRSSATAPTYLSRHIKARVSERTLCLSTVPIPLLDKPFTRTDFARRAFRCSAPTVWNSLPETVISADSLSVFHGPEIPTNERHISKLHGRPHIVSAMGAACFVTQLPRLAGLCCRSFCHSVCAQDHANEHRSNIVGMGKG